MSGYINKSARDDWKTPRWLYEQLNAEFEFDFDPCPPNPQFDGLAVSWGARNFVNPPYGRPISDWLKKALHERQIGNLSVFLIPSRTDTGWWHDYVMPHEVRFLRGRLKFDDGANPAPFASAVVVIRP
jgi:site-specific DNA-methyltransferase (adenine-specific)